VAAVNVCVRQSTTFSRFLPAHFDKLVTNKQSSALKRFTGLKRLNVTQQVSINALGDLRICGQPINYMQ
jgi:hypothetical protein